MKLAEHIKNLIRQEYNTFKEKMYAGKTKEERDELAQFFTPPEISIKLIEELTDLNGNILDPTCGSGNLLAAAIIAGADINCVFGNDYDLTMVNLCRDRLNNICDMLGKPHIKDWQIHQGNALQARCLVDFSPEYCGVKNERGDTLPHYQAKYINDLQYAQTYDHDVKEEGLLSDAPITHEEAKSWRWENEQARDRKNKRDIAAAEKASRLIAEQEFKEDPIKAKNNNEAYKKELDSINKEKYFVRAAWLSAYCEKYTALFAEANKPKTGNLFDEWGF